MNVSLNNVWFEKISVLLNVSGVKDKISYFESLGINTIWLNAIYKSDGLYDGNDVIDHKDVEEIFGGMAAFDALRKASKKKGLWNKYLFYFIHTLLYSTFQYV